MKNQVYYIQLLLADELNRCKGKENSLADDHIKTIQNTYYKTHQNMPQSMIVNKRKQKKQYTRWRSFPIQTIWYISSKSSKSEIPEPTFVQDKVDSLEEFMKSLQLPTKTMLFYVLPHYKSLWLNREQDEQYWNEVAIEFLKLKYNVDMTRHGFPIKMYIGGLL